jgi:hypothetical protein
MLRRSFLQALGAVLPLGALSLPTPTPKPTRRPMPPESGLPELPELPELVEFERPLFVPAAGAAARLRTLFELTGRTNGADFLGHPPGRCLFLGASGSRGVGGGYHVRCRFGAAVGAGSLDRIYPRADLAALGVS